MRFPRMHIAESVANRILNIADRVRPIESVTSALPVVPDPTAAGAAIDAAVRQPGVAVTPPAGGEQVMLDAALKGDSALDEAMAAEIIS